MSTELDGDWFWFPSHEDGTRTDAERGEPPISSGLLDGSPILEELVLDDEYDEWPHVTKTTLLFGREGRLMANADWSMLLFLLSRDGGGFEPTVQDIFEALNELTEGR